MFLKFYIFNKKKNIYKLKKYIIFILLYIFIYNNSIKLIFSKEKNNIYHKKMTYKNKIKNYEYNEEYEELKLYKDTGYFFNKEIYQESNTIDDESIQYESPFIRGVTLFLVTFGYSMFVMYTGSYLLSSEPFNKINNLNFTDNYKLIFCLTSSSIIFSVLFIYDLCN